MKQFLLITVLAQLLTTAVWASNYVPYEPSPVICKQNPYLAQCNGTREQCEANAYLAQCNGTRAQCEANPYLAQCNGTPAQCEANPYLAQCQTATVPAVDPAIDTLCRDHGYSR